MFQSLVARFHAPTPAFWRKARNRSLAAAGLLMPLTALPLVPPLPTLVGYAIAVLTGFAAAAQFTCDDAAPTTSPTTDSTVAP